MSDVIPELRRVAEWLQSWDPDEGTLHSAAADRIEALKAEVERLRVALRNLVQMNVEHNDAVAAVIRRPVNWSDNYLDEARAALGEAKETE